MCLSSSDESLAHAEELAAHLGIELLTVDITGAVDAYITAADPDADPTRRGNVMARVRMITLFDLSAKYGALPLGTGILVGELADELSDPGDARDGAVRTRTWVRVVGF